MAKAFAPLLALACIAAACAPAQAPSPAEAAFMSGNPASGLRYAEQACAQCHAIAPGSALSPAPDAPPFEAIANTPGMTRMALNAWLHSPHENMPQLIVDPDRIDDLSAYLATLKREGR
jgi:mono/diheme cytochrome c family protein